MTAEREARHVQRALRRIPVDAIAPRIAAEESDGIGLWGLVAGEVAFVSADDRETITEWEDMLDYSQYRRWLADHPERVHDTPESATAFVRSRLSGAV
jgi:hypothetical protein